MIDLSLSHVELLPQIAPEEFARLDERILGEDGRVRLLPAEAYADIPRPTLRVWMQMHARYLLPTTELVAWVQERIAGRSALEIGAGMGDFGRLLGIRMTDSGIQEKPTMQMAYGALDSQVTRPPADVERIDGYAAVRKYKPSVCVAAWVTQKFVVGDNLGHKIASSIHGVDEVGLLGFVDEYIFVGNVGPHDQKRLWSLPPFTLLPQPGWIVSRAVDPEKDFIAVWPRRKRRR